MKWLIFREGEAERFSSIHYRLLID